MTAATHDGPLLSHRQIMVIFTGLMSGMLLAALDQTIVSTALPTIVGDLHGLNHLSWVVSAYMLTSTASTPLYGKISDLYGRKPVFQTAIVIFLAGSALSGISQSMNELIAFRAVQGLGAGGLMALAMAIVGDIVSPRERGRYQGYIGGVFAFASVTGPLIGGIFTDQLSWRWCFYVNIPVGIVALLITSAVLRYPFARVQHAIDYVGSALLVAAITLLLLVTVWGGNQYAWGSPTILGLVGAGVVLLVVFALWERRVDEPVLPPRLFRLGVYNLTNGAGFLVGFAMFGATVFLPLYLQLVTGISPTLSGLQILPLMAGMMVTSIATGRLITRTGRYKRYPVAGAVVMPIGLWLLSLMGPHTSRALMSAYMVLLGVGMGLIMQVLVIAVQNAVDYRDLGTATSSNTFFRSMGGAFGVAVFGSILVARLNFWIPRLVPPLPGGRRLPTSVVMAAPAVVRRLPAPIRDGAIASFSHSLHSVFLWSAPVAALALPLVLAMKELPLRSRVSVSVTEEPSGAVEQPAAVEPVTDGAIMVGEVAGDGAGGGHGGELPRGAAG